MAREEYPLLPAELPSSSMEPAPPAPEPVAAAPDPLIEQQIRLLATDALPAWTSSSMPVQPPVAQPVRVVPVEPPPRRSRVRSCLSIALAVLVIISLLGSSAFSLVWFLGTRSERQAEVAALLEEPAASALEQAATAVPPTREERPAVVAVAAQGEPVNRIVFTNEQAAIETMAPDGSERRILTEDGKAYQLPAWAPDGRALAAVGGSLRGGGIYVIEDVEDAGEPEEIFFSDTQSPFYLYWSPDGQQISFLANSRTSGIELKVLPGTGGESRTVALGSPMYWNWTADSKQMLIHSGDTSEDGKIALIDDKGQMQGQRVPSPGYFQAPGISASGRYWAYSQVRAGDTNWLITDDRDEDKQEGYRHAGAIALSWSPVRDEVAYVSGDPDSQFSTWGPLRLLDAASGETRMLSTDTVLAFFWSPDGRKIATVSLPADPLLGEQFEVQGNNGRQFARYESTRQPAQNRGHSFRISVIDVESGEGRDLTEQVLSPLFLAQFLPYFDQYALSHTIWSPASDAIVLPLVEDRQSFVSVVDTRNGRVEQLAEGQIGFWTHQ